jgi:hypothetical protein
LIRTELGFSRDEFRALSWVDQRMYIEELSIFLYYKDLAQWKSLPEEEKWEHDEPIKPEILIDREVEEWEKEREIMPPDIFS